MSENVQQIASSDSSLLTCKQVSERWGVNPGTVRNWISRGVIPGTEEPLPYMKVGSKVRFSPDQVQYIESHMVRGGAPTDQPRTTPRSGAA